MRYRIGLLEVGFGLLAVLTTTYWLLVIWLADLGVWLARFPYIAVSADVFMGASGAVACYGLASGRRYGLYAGFLAAGACLFVGITAFEHNLRSGQLFAPDLVMLVEIISPACLLVLGCVALFMLPARARAGLR
jgi:hypothetical protein